VRKHTLDTNSLCNIRVQSLVTRMNSDLYRLTATEVLNKIKAGEVSVEDYAKSLLTRIEVRDSAVQAWAYMDPGYVMRQAKTLDTIPPVDRGPLHGVAIAVKDVIYTKGKPYWGNTKPW
jgi:Asp-tRNA(Asn)/Glu-tRNA(Gln) amidotransferase A subunit family amidase